MSLSIEKQESLASDKFTRNGKNKVLHIVAKNIPFVLHVAATVNFNQCPLHAKLYYDWDTEADIKEVDTLKSSPMEYTAHVSAGGLKAVVEFRLGVLSSQHEQAYFRIKLSTSSGEVWSQPMKVISKRNQVRKMLAKNEIAPCNVNMSALPVPKRTTTDSIADALIRLEQQQQEQARLLHQLVASNKSNNVITTQYAIPDPSDMDFETAFAAFLRTFRAVSAEERPNKIRKALCTLDNANAVALDEFVGAYHTEMALASLECGSPTSFQTTPDEEKALEQLCSGVVGSSPSSSPLLSPSSSPLYDETDPSSWFALEHDLLGSTTPTTEIQMQ